MQVFVYRSRRREGAYLYLAERDAFERVPPPLSERLGPFDFALEFALTPQRRLAREDPEVVRANLVAQGFHLQLPPPEPVLDGDRRG